MPLPELSDLPPADRAKLASARRAVSFVSDGMKVGLGTGSTAAWMVKCLALRIKHEGINVIGVPTSERTGALAASLGVKLATLDEFPELDITIDGADEIDPSFNLIKGGGAALLREKIVASSSRQMIVIADKDKEVSTLGAFALPVEVIPFGWKSTFHLIEKLLKDHGMGGAKIARRLFEDNPLLTDQGNYILDLQLKAIKDPLSLSVALNQIAGVVENGLFTGICKLAVIGDEAGNTYIREG